MLFPVLFLAAPRLQQLTTSAAAVVRATGANRTFKDGRTRTDGRGRTDADGRTRTPLG